MTTTSTAKVALVTGASSGIGEATARQLAAAGFTVYAAARRTERMQQLTEAGIRPIAMDVTDDASMQTGVKTILNEQGRIRTITKAVTARRPKTRYAVGYGAKPIILMHDVLPDRAFDALIRRATGVPS